MRRTVFKIFFVLVLPLTSPGLAADQSWLMSIPHAISSAHIYKVVIQSIDGKPSESAVRYPIKAGEHKISVSLQLDVEWSPDLVETPGQMPYKQLVINIEGGKTYLIAARVDIDAPADSQLDDSFWEPFVYRILGD
jgi:hypothetical protein